MRKFLVIILACMSVFCSSLTAFATDYKVLDTSNISLPEGTNLLRYYIIYYNDFDQLRVVTSDSPIYLFYSNSTYLFSDDKLTLSGTTTSKTLKLYTFSFDYSRNLYINLRNNEYYSNFDLCCYSDSTNYDIIVPRSAVISDVNITNAIGNMQDNLFNKSVYVLVIVGIGILALFISVKLIKRVVYNFF